MNASGDVACHGAVLGQKSVLTSASCMSALKHLQVTVGEQRYTTHSS